MERLLTFPIHDFIYLSYRLRERISPESGRRSKRLSQPFFMAVENGRRKSDEDFRCV